MGGRAAQGGSRGVLTLSGLPGKVSTTVPRAPVGGPRRPAAAATADWISEEWRAAVRPPYPCTRHPQQRLGTALHELGLGFRTLTRF